MEWLLKHLLLLLLLSIYLHEIGQDVDGHGEDDSAVVLSRNAVQGLEISQLKRNIN